MDRKPIRWAIPPGVEGPFGQLVYIRDQQEILRQSFSQDNRSVVIPLGNGFMAHMVLGPVVDFIQVIPPQRKQVPKEVQITGSEYWIPVLTNPPTAAKWVKLDANLKPMVGTLTAAVPTDIAAKSFEQFGITRETHEDGFEPILYAYDSASREHVWFSMFHGREVYTVGEREGYASMHDVRLVITHEAALAGFKSGPDSPPPAPSVVTPAKSWSPYSVPSFDSSPGHDQGYYGWYSSGRLTYSGKTTGSLVDSSILYDVAGQKVGVVEICELSGSSGPGPTELFTIVNPYTTGWVHHDNVITTTKLYLLLAGERPYVFDGHSPFGKGWERRGSDSAFFCMTNSANTEVRVDLFEGSGFHVTRSLGGLVEVLEGSGAYLPFVFAVNGINYYGAYGGIRRTK